MRRRDRMRGTALLLGAALAVTVAGPAYASGPTPQPTDSSTTSPASSAVQQLAAEIVSLQQTAEKKGEVAAKAGERADSAAATANIAQQAMLDAQVAADVAVARAGVSRSRAAASAAQLARTDLGTLPLDLMLNASSATGMLGGLSTAGQLTEQSHLLYAQALADEATATRLKAVAAQRAAASAAAAKKAESTYAAAKRDAASAQRQVEQAESRQQALLTQLFATNDGTNVCADLTGAPVDVCLPSTTIDPNDHSVGARVVAFAVAQIGKPYVFAAAGPNAYDCSGLTLAAYASAGVSIGIHSATAQYRLAVTQGDLVPMAKARPGDLLFYTDGGGDMYHVTIYAGSGLMIEAPYPGASVREVPVRTGDLVPQAAHFG